MMNSRPFSVALAASLALVTQWAAARDDTFKPPDSLVMKDGRIIHGLIIRNSRDEVLIQENFAENSYLKKDILRILDEADINELFTDISRKGDLPAWRVIANDLRTHDEIKSLVEIPATVIDQGVLVNVPYKSFRVNGDIELNIYGDPDDPAGLEVGIYGSRSGNLKLRKLLRAYMAGFLTTRAEVATLYSLDLKGGIKDAGSLTVEITPKNAPDAYGAWWISFYNKKRLDAVRLSDAEYSRMVRPMNEVVDRKGRVISGGWSEKEMKMSPRVTDGGPTSMVLLRGFYRDKNGDFRLITQQPEPGNPKSGATPQKPKKVE